MSTSNSWSTQQLAEFLTSVSSCSTPGAAIHGAIEHAAAALEAEVGAVVDHEIVLASIGFPPGEEPVDVLVDAARRGRGMMDVAGVGKCTVITTPLGEASGTRLLLARSTVDEFTPEEFALLRGMGRVLTLTLDSLRVLEAERSLRADREAQAEENARLAASLQQRQALLEASLSIQRAIATREPLQDVLDRIVDRAAFLLDADAAALRIVEQANPEYAQIVASYGVTPELALRMKRSPTHQGISGRAMREERLVIAAHYPSDPWRFEEYAADGVSSAAAAPVHANGVVVGSLVVAVRGSERTFTVADRDMIVSFAEHASLAITDARTLERMHQAFHDSLTGLPNRALFFDRLDQALARRNRDHGEVAVLFADLDRFKVINDSLGHGVGDLVLAEVAARLRAYVRAEDTVARLGGDEFALIIEGVGSPVDVIPVAMHICEALRRPFSVADREMFTGASIGIALSSERHAEAGEILRDADVAMYQAKSDGRGSYAIFSPDMHLVALRRLDMEADLQRALEREEFALLYQPLIELATGRTSGVEALVRWRHPSRGLISPLEFIPIAEETGLIVQIGEWILREACRQGQVWVDNGDIGEEFTISVNVSAREFKQDTFVEGVAETLRETGLHPARLVLEVTESLMLHEAQSAIAKLDELKAIGVTLAIDDFGTGYSSLSYLRHLPVDVLKIDKSFVDGVALGPDDSALARAILKLSQTLNLRTVAEGVETAEQAHRLREMRCDVGQGFFFARPLQADAVVELVRQQRDQSRPELALVL